MSAQCLVHRCANPLVSQRTSLRIATVNAVSHTGRAQQRTPAQCRSDYVQAESSGPGLLQGRFPATLSCFVFRCSRRAREPFRRSRPTRRRRMRRSPG